MLKYLLLTTPLFEMDTGGAPGASSASTGSGSPSSDATSTDTGASPSTAESPREPASDVDTGAPRAEAEPKLSLEEQLSAVWDDAQKPEGPQRGPDGKFISSKPKVEGEQPPTGEPHLEGDNPPDTTHEQLQDGQEPPTADNATPAGDMPKSWKKEHAQVWASLPPEAREIISTRETQVREVLGRVGNEVSAWRHNQPIVRAVEPYKDYLVQVGQHLGKHPAQLINDVLRFEHTLRTAQSNEDRIGVLTDIIAEYGIDVSGLVDPRVVERIVGSREGQAGQRLQALESENQNLRRQLGEIQGRQAQEESQAFTGHIQTARADTANFPHFDAVRAEMVGILMAPNANDAGKTIPQLIKEAYDAACWANPKIRAQLVQTATQKQQEEARRAAEEKARRADAASGVNVRGGTPGTAKRSMDDTLKSVADKHYR